MSILTIYNWMIQFIQRLTTGKKMSLITFKFNESKATEVILYLTQKLSIPNVYRICKLLYLSDKASLAKYGRFIFGESYVAMRGGGTPSNVYDLLKRLRSTPTDALKVDGNIVRALRNPDLDYLSKSDLECLDLVISRYGKNWTDMKNDAHDDAWQGAWDNKGVKQSNQIPVENIARMFPDSNDLIDYLSNSG